MQTRSTASYDSTDPPTDQPTTMKIAMQFQCDVVLETSSGEVIKLGSGMYSIPAITGWCFPCNSHSLSLARNSTATVANNVSIGRVENERTYHLRFSFVAEPSQLQILTNIRLSSTNLCSHLNLIRLYLQCCSSKRASAHLLSVHLLLQYLGEDK